MLTAHYLYKNWTVKGYTEDDEYVASYRWHVLRASSKAEIETLIDERGPVDINYGLLKIEAKVSGTKADK